jgi:glycosyltransferase involved in cell wall biosynthesis
VYRNADQLRALHARLTQVCRSSPDHELLFVNDACPAGSLDVLQALALTDPHVSVLDLPHNVGQNQAVLIGLSFTRRNHVVVMDGDLQDPPEAIPELLATLRPPIGAVFAGRRGAYESTIRLLTSRLLKSTLHRLFGQRLPRDAGLYMAISGAMRDTLNGCDVRDPYVLSLMARTGLPMASIPVERSPRQGEHSAYSFWRRLHIGYKALHTAFCPIGRRKPEKRYQPAMRSFGARFKKNKE